MSLDLCSSQGQLCRKFLGRLLQRDFAVLLPRARQSQSRFSFPALLFGQSLRSRRGNPGQIQRGAPTLQSTIAIRRTMSLRSNLEGRCFEFIAGGLRCLRKGGPGRGRVEPEPPPAGGCERLTGTKIEA